MEHLEDPGEKNTDADADIRTPIDRTVNVPRMRARDVQLTPYTLHAFAFGFVFAHSSPHPLPVITIATPSGSSTYAQRWSKQRYRQITT